MFRDNGAEPISTTTTAVDWTYSFDNLPKYAVGEAVGEGEVVDGHEYIYTVKEVKVDGFTTKYNGYDIINTYDRSADTEVSVQKRWIDFGTNVTTHSAITIELYQNNVLYDTVQLSDENDWNTTFVELPKYDANQQPFDYTVKDELGIHARPAGLLVKEAKNFTSKITIKKGEKEVDATRVMAVMALGVKQGETVTVNVDGADEDAAVAAMKAFFEKEL